MNTTLDQISAELFKNRQTFLRYNQFKINRILNTLAPSDRQVFTLIPRLLHINQPGLPGYIHDEVPRGIHNYPLSLESRFAAEYLFPDAIYPGNEDIRPFIQTILLMGSTGSIAQSQKSDLDFTVFIDKNSVTKHQLELFNKKLKMIEEWTWNTYKLEIHFFSNDIQEVRNNIFGEADTESTGSALAKLLKEEMYRTAVITAGKIPFWWVVPLKTDDRRYGELLDLVHSHQTLLNPDDFLDIGNVDDISQGEFFGGCIWTLIKSFKAPFKTLIKMGLLEEYMFNDTRSNLLCHEIKKKVFGGIPFENIDTYINLFERVEKYYQKTKSKSDLDVLRTAFYLKVGTKVTRQDLEDGSPDPRRRILIDLINSWDWQAERLEQLNSYSRWQMMEKVALGNRVNKILMNAYRNISEANKKLSPEQSLITERDTNLLGRKLFSFYRKAVNKVESLFALVDGDTSERELTFLHHQLHPRDKGTWYLIRGKTLAYLEQIPPDDIIKKASTLQFLIAFTCFNSLYNQDTVLMLRAERESIKDFDLKNLLGDLSSFLSQVNIADIPNEALLADAHVKQLYMIVDFGNPIPREITIGHIKNCRTTKEYFDFVNRRLERIKMVVTIYLTSWGELYCKTYTGLHCMARCLANMRPQVLENQLENPQFLKVFVPGSRLDAENLFWLNRYIIKSLRAKTRKTDSPTLSLQS